MAAWGSKRNHEQALISGANGGIQSSALGATGCPGAKDSERLSDGPQPQVEI